MKITTNEKYAAGAASLVIALLYFMPKALHQTASGISPSDMSGLNGVALNAGGGASIPAYVPTTLPPLSTNSGSYSTNVPWWLTNNNSTVFQGIAPLTPLALPSNTVNCNTCSLMSNFFGGGL